MKKIATHALRSVFCATLAVGITVVLSVSSASADEIEFGKAPAGPSTGGGGKADWSAVLKGMAGAFVRANGQMVLENDEGPCLAVLASKVPPTGILDSPADSAAADAFVAAGKACKEANPGPLGTVVSDGDLCLLTLRWKKEGGKEKVVVGLASLTDIEACASKPPVKKGGDKGEAASAPAFSVSSWLGTNFQVPAEAAAAVPRNVPLTSGSCRADSLDLYRVGKCGEKGWKMGPGERAKALRTFGFLLLSVVLASLFLRLSHYTIRKVRGASRGLRHLAPKLGVGWRAIMWFGWFIVTLLVGVKLDIWVMLWGAVVVAALLMVLNVWAQESSRRRVGGP